MIVFKTFLKVLNKCKVPVIFYTALLLIFSITNMKTSDNSMGFVASKPDVMIINNDTDNKITNNLIEYLEKRSNVIEDVDNVDDAIFFRNLNYVIYIPENYGSDFLEGKDPSIEVKSTGDYQASLEEMMLDKYLKVANIYLEEYHDEDLIIKNINNTMDNEVDVDVKSSLDTDAVNLTGFYFSFLTYSILAGTIYVICLIISIFREESVSKRITISSMDYKKHNRLLLVSNILFSIFLWMIYILVSFFICKKIMFTKLGIIYIINSFVFTIMSTTLALLISSLVSNKNAISGIVNVLALGSSFLCGVFVPMSMLPKTIKTIAHVLPTYWYVRTIEEIPMLEEFTFKTLKPIIVNTIILVLFAVLFVIINNIISKRKQKYD